MTWRNGKDVTKPRLERRCPEAKICPNCKKPLFRNCFYFAFHTKDYLSPLCKECTKKREKQKRQGKTEGQGKTERILEWLKKKENK